MKKENQNLKKLCHIHHSSKESNGQWTIPRVGDTTDRLTEVTTINQLRKTSYSKHCLPQISMNIELHTIYILGSYS